MNTSQLEKKINKLNIRHDAYSLNGGNPSQAYVLSQEAEFWSVYYSERGIKIDERKFKSEDEACRYFLDIISEDKITYK